MAYKRITPQPVVEGGTGVATLTGVATGNGTSALTAAAVTEYGVLVGDASNAVASTAVGTATHVLTSNGAGVAPTFQAAAGGGGSGGAWEYVSTTTISNDATINFTGLTGIGYMFVLKKIKPVSDANLTIKVSDDGGSTWEALDYQSAIAWTDVDDLYGTTNLDATSILVTNNEIGNGASEYGFSGIFKAFNLNNASYPVSISWDCIGMIPDGDISWISGSGISADNDNGGSTLDVDGIQFYFSTGNLSTGTIYLYKSIIS
jgi:hypothetical protein